MSTTTPGAAREIPAGRLASFEDADDDAPKLSLPPRRRANTPPAAAAEAPAQESAAAPTPPSEPAPAQPAPRAAATAPTPATAGEQVAPEDTSGKGPEDIVRPSNVHIPVSLLKPVEEACRSKNLSHGEVIIIAVEATYDRLGQLINPVATAGGSLFAPRRSSRASRTGDGPLTPLNYRLREGDFATLDALVEEFGASSRGHLITAALKGYFADQL